MPSDDYPTVGGMLNAVDEDSGAFRDLKELQDQAVRRAVRDIQRQRAEYLLEALDEGYDGVDFVPYPATQAHEIDSAEAVTIQEQARPWRGSPPAIEHYPSHVQQVNRVVFDEHPDDVIRERIREQIEQLEADDAE